MIAIIIWLAASVLVGLLAGCFIRVGAADPSQESPTCNQNCRQGRDCRCGAVVKLRP